MKILLVLIISLGGFCASFAQDSAAKNVKLPKMKNPRLVVIKSERKLNVFDGKKFVKSYKIALGFAPDGDKQIEGDGKTPEGEFYISAKNDKSKFFLSLGLSYPNIAAAERGLREKIIAEAERDAIVRAIGEKRMPPQKTRLGGEIYIHGGGAASDWTWGCIALENDEIQELFDALPVGTIVSVKP